MHDLDLILTIAGSLGAALVFGYLTQRIGLSPIVGYLLAGVAVGPFTPGFVANHEFAEQLAEIGVVLLMFGVGLHFHFKELLAVRCVAIPGAVVQSLVATALGAVITHAFGWSWTAGVVFGLSISVASTVVLIRVLSDNNDLHSPAGHIAVGWLVVEDLFTVIILVILPTIFGPGNATTGDIAIGLGVTLLKVGGLVAFTFLVGGKVIPWLLEKIAATRSRELFTLAVLVVALGIAIGSTMVFGVSMALGAFLAGMVVGRSEFSVRAAADALPMRDAFAVLFFVSVGMLFSPAHLISEPGLVAATLAIVLLAKAASAFAFVVLLRYPLRTALSVAIALSQIGEFSFILASVGRQLGILDVGATATLVAASIVSITLNPILYRSIPHVERWVARHPAIAAWFSRRTASVLPDAGAERPDRGAGRPDPHRAVIIGYGPVGRTIVRLLRENRIEPSIIELNLETVRELVQAGISATYGDAGQRDVLEAAGVARAGTLIISVAGLESAPEIIRIARELNSSIWIIARTDFAGAREALRDAGANEVYSAESEIALAFATSTMRHLGATPEQLDGEIARVRREMDSVANDHTRPAITEEYQERTN